MSETYKVTYEPTGRVWELRKIPKHFFLMFGQLPQALTAKATTALQSGDSEAFEEEIKSTLSEKQIFDAAIFAREAVKYACINPKIVLMVEDPASEILAFDVTEDEFNFLVRTATSGGNSPAANKFRGKSR